VDNELDKTWSDRRTKYPFLTANLCNNAVSELFCLDTKHYDPKAGYLLSSFTIRFFRAALQYMFNAEYCKLFELEDNRRTSHVSSLVKLNNYHSKILGKKFGPYFHKNEELLNGVLDSEFYQLQRDLRDTKFAHSDIAEKNNFTIAALTDDEIETAFNHLRVALEIINNCHAIFDRSYFFFVPNKLTTTQNFVKQHTEYQEFFFKEANGKEL